MKVLVSVRTVDEALMAARAGVHFIDLKEPREGALGGLPLSAIREIVDALRDDQGAAPCTLSATIGDWPVDALHDITERVHAVAACGVDLVKVGVEHHGTHTPALLDHLAALVTQSDARLRIVPVLLADHGLHPGLVAHAARLPFAALMADTADKLAGSLFDCVPLPALQHLVRTARAAQRPVGVAGALRLPDMPRLHALQPDFAGFRTAVCAGDRTQALDAQRLTALLRTASAEVADASH